MREIIEFNSISSALHAMGLEKPKHPLVSVFNHRDIKNGPQFAGKSIVSSFYIMEYKDGATSSFEYGRTTYDFEEGTLIFLAPKQVLKVNEWYERDSVNGWTLLFHPDLIRKSQLGQNIDSYSFFSYETNEALHISDEEKKIVDGLKDKIVQEYSQNIDRQSQKLIVTSIELLLDYCTRYYNRQFFTRENLNKDIITRFETMMKAYYESNKPLEQGMPSVKYCGEFLNMSPNYFSDLLKKETGRNAQDHIHFFVIERAKTQLLNTEASISHIAYDLGFEYPQNFSKLFKKKTGISPSEFRNMN
jgi:AraC-like DNA-binding protein